MGMGDPWNPFALPNRVKVCLGIEPWPGNDVLQSEAEYASYRMTSSLMEEKSLATFQITTTSMPLNLLSYIFFYV